QDALKSLDAELSQKNRSLNDAKSALMTLESQSAHNRNELGALDHKKKHDLIRAERLSAEKLQLEDQRRALEARLELFSTGLTGLRNAVTTLRATLSVRADESAALAEQLRNTTNLHHTSASKVSQ